MSVRATVWAASGQERTGTHACRKDRRAKKQKLTVAVQGRQASNGGLVMVAEDHTSNGQHGLTLGK